MATVEQVAQLRRMIAEPTDDPYTDEMLGNLIDSYGDEAPLPLASAANTVWLQKAAEYLELVNISEGGSSRANGELYDRALKMAGLYEMQIIGATDASRGTRIARLVR